MIPVSVTASDVEWYPEWLPEAPNELLAGETLVIDDTTAAGDLIASTTWAATGGQDDQATVNLVVADPLDPPVTVRIWLRDLDEDGNQIYGHDNGPVTVTSTPQEFIIDGTDAPAGVWTRVVEIRSDEAAPGAPVQTNIAPDPRGANPDRWSARLGWSGPSVDTSHTNIGGVPGLNTCMAVTAPAATSYTDAGINLTGDPNGSAAPDSPIAVEPGVTYTVSAWVLSSRAMNGAIRRRFVDEDGDWATSAATTAATAVAASTWTRISYTVTIPAGCYGLVVAFIASGSFATATGTTFKVSGVLLEASGSVGTYFDGVTANGLGGSVRWAEAANDGPSWRFAGAVGGRTLVAPSGLISRGAAAGLLLGSALERDLRRSVADLFLARSSLVTAGVPGLLKGTLTFLCNSWRQAVILDEVYQLPGDHILSTGEGEALDGLVHVAVESLRITSEQGLNGVPSRWQVQASIRERGTE